MTDECIEWTGALMANGYGRSRGTTAHRAVWEQANGPIGDSDMVVDHICFNRACVNLDHLRLMPRGENAARQRRALSETCARGHVFDEANTYWFKPEQSKKYGGRRRCRACDAYRHREAWKADKESAA